MSQKVYVTGLGVVSAMGLGVEANLTSAKTGQTFVRKPLLLDTLLNKNYPLAEVTYSDLELKSLLNLTSDSYFSRTSLMAMLAVKEAIHSASFTSELDNRTALISGTSVGGMDKGEEFFDGFIRKNGNFDLHHALIHDCGESTLAIAKHFKIKGYTSTISTACSSAANAIMLAARLIKAGKIDRAIAGGTDALTRFTLNGFRSLMILSDEPSQPFDLNRKGLNLGEGAGYIILESEEILKKENRKPICELSGYANTCDAYHQTASSPEGNGARLAINGALKKANLSPADIDYINTHGTGTPNNDLSEGKAMKHIFGDILPAFSSTKSLTGHTLGAAGGIEAVLATLSIQRGIIYPNLNFQQPIEELGIIPATEWESDKSIKHVLSNSFGFGGNNTSLIFSAC
jgi:3-oxoacyl-(acyl-carrier-protein) synthase